MIAILSYDELVVVSFVGFCHGSEDKNHSQRDKADEALGELHRSNVDKLRFELEGFGWSKEEERTMLCWELKWKMEFI